MIDEQLLIEQKILVKKLINAIEAIISTHNCLNSCKRKDHKPLRFPLCAACQLDARIEEAGTLARNSKTKEREEKEEKE